MATQTQKSATTREHSASNRPAANSAAENETAEKRGPGRPKSENSSASKPTGKAEYPGIVGGKKLSTVPTDWNGDVHKRLREGNFENAALFTAWKEANKKERNFHPSLLNAEGKPENKLSEFPSDANVEIVYDYNVGGEKIVGFKPRHFNDRRTLARALVPVLQAEIAKLDKIANMSDEQLQKLAKREELQKAIGRKVQVSGGQVVDKEALEALVSMLPAEMREKLGMAG